MPFLGEKISEDEIILSDWDDTTFQPPAEVDSIETTKSDEAATTFE